MKKKLRFFLSEGLRKVSMAESEKPEDALCDFCSSILKPLKEYPCKDFQALSGTWSRGPWAACAKCAEFIDADDPKGLLDRCGLLMEIESVPGSKEILGRFHKKFFENRIK